MLSPLSAARADAFKLKISFDQPTPEPESVPNTFALTSDPFSSETFPFSSPFPAGDASSPFGESFDFGSATSNPFVGAFSSDFSVPSEASAPVKFEGDLS